MLRDRTYEPYIFISSNGIVFLRLNSMSPTSSTMNKKALFTWPLKWTESLLSQTAIWRQEGYCKLPFIQGPLSPELFK